MQQLTQQGAAQSQAPTPAQAAPQAQPQPQSPSHEGASDGANEEPLGILTVTIVGARRLVEGADVSGLSSYCVIDYDQQQVCALISYLCNVSYIRVHSFVYCVCTGAHGAHAWPHSDMEPDIRF